MDLAVGCARPCAGQIISCMWLEPPLTGRRPQIAGEHFGSPKDAAASVVRTAYQKGSGDNLTAIVVEFGWVDPKRVMEGLEKAKPGAGAAVEEDLDMFGD